MDDQEILNEFARAETLLICHHLASRPKGSGYEVDVSLIPCEGPNRLTEIHVSRYGKFAEKVRSIPVGESRPVRLESRLTARGTTWFDVHISTAIEDSDTARAILEEWAELDKLREEAEALATKAAKDAARQRMVEAAARPMDTSWMTSRQLAFHENPDDPQFKQKCLNCETVIVVPPGHERYRAHLLCGPCGLREVRGKNWASG